MGSKGVTFLWMPDLVALLVSSPTTYCLVTPVHSLPHRLEHLHEVDE